MKKHEPYEVAPGVYLVSRTVTSTRKMHAGDYAALALVVMLVASALGAILT